MVAKYLGLRQATEAHPILITVSVMLATVMQVLDTTIANVALPHMQGSLSASTDQISWVLTSYIVAAAITTPAVGSLAARFGRKKLLLWSIAGFTVTSMLCGAAASLEEMVLFRLFQGIFGASLVPLSQAILLDAYPKEKHGTALALWGIGVMVGPILGPTLGGYLTENFNWRWVFYINLPFGLMALAGTWIYVHETMISKGRKWDWLGFTMLAIAIGALQLMLDRGEQKDWFSSAEILGEMVLSGLCFYLFIVHMFTCEHPFLQPKLFVDRNFVTGCCFMFVVGIILLATIALLPPYMQNLLGYPVVTVGYLLAPRGIGTMVAMIAIGRIINRFDPRIPIAVGLMLIAYSLFDMSGFGPDIGQGAVIWTGIVQGLGLGLVFVPLGSITFATLPGQFRTEAAGFFSLVRNIGSSIGISVIIALLTENGQINHATLTERLGRFSINLQHLPSLWSSATSAGRSAFNAEVTRQALFIAYNNDFLFMAWIAFFTLPLVLLLRRPNVKKT